MEGLKFCGWVRAFVEGSKISWKGRRLYGRSGDFVEGVWDCMERSDILCKGSLWRSRDVSMCALINLNMIIIIILRPTLHVGPSGEDNHAGFVRSRDEQRCNKRIVSKQGDPIKVK